MKRIRNKNGTFKSLHGGDQERVLKCMYAIFQEKGKKLGSTSKEIHAMYEKWFGKKPKSTISSILNVLEYQKKLIVSREYYSQTHIYASGIHKNCPEKIREYHWNWNGEQVINQKLIEAKERINANKKLQKTTARISLSKSNRYEKSI